MCVIADKEKKERSNGKILKQTCSCFLLSLCEAGCVAVVRGADVSSAEGTMCVSFSETSEDTGRREEMEKIDFP